jgi:DNA-binding NtrC family response regulator
MGSARPCGETAEGFSANPLGVRWASHWPGNRRELQHVIERAVILTPHPIILPHGLEGTRFGLAHSLNAPGAGGPKTAVLGSLTSAMGTAAVGAGANGGVAVKSGAVVLEPLDLNEAEWVLIGRALEASGGNRTKAAEPLGMSVRALPNKLNGPGKGDEEDVA